MKLEPGDKAPGFSRIDELGATRTLADFSGCPLVVYFYPKVFTSGCTEESCDFRDRHETFSDKGYQIIGVSPDPVDRLGEFKREYRLPFSLLSDEDHAMADAFGAWGTKTSYGKQVEGLIRSTFVIDANGRVEHAWYNVRAKGHAERVASATIGH